MNLITRLVVPGCIALTLAACSGGSSNGPLAYVPADTPFLVANTEPLSEAARAALLASGVYSSLRVDMLNGRADQLQKLGRQDLANLYRALARLFIVKTPAEFEAQTGIDGSGRFALYGLASAVVVRGELSDPAQFHVRLDALEKAYGHPFATGTAGDINYQSIRLARGSNQLVVATHGGEFVFALMSVDASPDQLRVALGAELSATSVRDSGRLRALMQAKGYGPYMAGYVDTTLLSKLWADGTSPVIGWFTSLPPIDASPVDNGNKAERALCAADLARVAARVPLVSFGFTKLNQKEQRQQMDIKLAPDIVEAFRSVGTEVPGLGVTASSAALDAAFALPVTEIRRFWSAQADAVAARPFQCPWLMPLNKSFAKLANFLPKTYLPPFGSLRGIRLVVDRLPKSQQKGFHIPAFRVAVATNNAKGIVGIAKALIPSLAELDLSDPTEPAPLPNVITARVHEPGWVAMNSKGLGVAFGDGERPLLADMLNAMPGKPGTLARMTMSQRFFDAQLNSMQQQLEKLRNQHTAASGALNNNDASDKAQLSAVIAAFKQLSGLWIRARMTDAGLRITSEVKRQSSR